MIIASTKVGKRQGVVAVGLGVLFTFVLASALWRHLDISCGCFSTSLAGKIGYLTLVRAMVITLVSAVAYVATILPQPKEARRAPVQANDKDHPCAEHVPGDVNLSLLAR
jgi:hypothetical protein